MNRRLINVYAFLLGFVLAAVALMPFAAHAYVVQTPTFSYYTPSAAAAQGMVNSGSAVYDGVTGKYLGSGNISVNGKALTVPGKFTPLSTAGQYAKNAMKLNPTKIAATLAAGWLIEQGLSWMADTQQWMKTAPAQTVHHGGWRIGTTTPNVYTDVKEEWCAATAAFYNKSPVTYCNGTPGSSISATIGGYGYSTSWANTDWCPSGTTVSGGSCVSAPVPATDNDWNNAPDPFPTVAPELPTAPYASGAPVNAPTFDFVPFSAPSGEPYTKPDGSTWQPMVTISPNVTNVTINNYDQKVTNVDGSPADPATPPVETPPPSDPCIDHPERVGCLDVGTLPEAEVLPRSTVDVVFSPLSLPLNMTCPAPVVLTLAGHSIPVAYDAICFYAESLRPFVLIVAMLAGAYIIFGVRRGGEE